MLAYFIAVPVIFVALVAWIAIERWAKHYFLGDVACADSVKASCNGCIHDACCALRGDVENLERGSHHEANGTRH